MSSKNFKNNFKHHWLQFINEGKECVNEFKNPKTRYKQIPNLFTASRLLAPFLIIPTALTGNLLLTSIFVAGFAFTDAVDGFLARKFNSSTEFGRKLDALTDKLFTGTVLFPLLFTNHSLIILLFMEGAISLVNVKAQLNNNTPKTEYIGKIKTAFLAITILINYVSMITNIPNNIIHLLTATTTILQLSSLIKYHDVDSNKEKLKETKQSENDMTTFEENAELSKDKKIELLYSATENCDIKQEDTILPVDEHIKQLKQFREQVQNQSTSEKTKPKTLENKIKR